LTQFGSLEYAGQTYRTVEIGDQTWMAENLNYNADGSKCYGEGGQVYDGGYFVELSSAEIQSNCDKYGRLYNWATAMANSARSTANPSGVKGVCPDGWHLPSYYEWETLINFVGTDAGTKLKSASGWNGTDNYGFSALPGGYGHPDGSFLDAGWYSCWWNSANGGNINSYGQYMFFGNTSAGFDPSNLFSVRCLQD